MMEDKLKIYFSKEHSFGIEALKQLRRSLLAIERIKKAINCIPELMKENLVSQNKGELPRFSEDEAKSVVSDLCEKLHIANGLYVEHTKLSKQAENALYYCSELLAENNALLSTCKIDRNLIDLPETLEKLSKIQKYEETMEIRDRDNIMTYGKLYLGALTKWDEILNIEALTKKVNEAFEKYNWDINALKKFFAVPDVGEQIEKMKTDAEKLLSYENDYLWICGLFDEKYRFTEQDMRKVSSKWGKCVQQTDTLDAWIDYRDCRKLCCDNGLEEFIIAAEDSYCEPGTLKNSFMKKIYLKWLEEIRNEESSIAQFRQSVRDSKIERFCELDEYQMQIAQSRICEKLVAERPNTSSFNRANDEVGILRHEMNKKRKIMPLRKLFKTIPNLILRLKPCMMMSPLSVSYFLEAETYKFDMVIFDEASQIFPQDAIGAIFRSKQVIIAGDSKQLPPTNFFAASTNNLDDDYDGDGDEEEIIYDSILEEAANNLPNRSLLWHYRSRSEELIAYSNQEIYGNNLITFPSSNTATVDSGVEYVYVEDGVYSGRCNVKEAKRCVELIKEHIIKHPTRSLGIIAFSEKQQATIEDEVHKFRELNPKYEYFFAEDKEAPFFIKNLENVQGDERDTIIFSICYAKNENGTMYMRFGPLGHQGGERRLNVAITRAKYNVKLVGSIMPQDINLSNTKSEGVKMLRGYIEFALKGSSVLKPHKNANSLYESDDFCNYILKFLSDRGYGVKQYVGNSDYKIDIAVEHPKYKGVFVAGIECDGDSYSSARTIRDREHLRKSVLEQMGWRMYRVWSTEWINNNEYEQKRLIDFINDSINSYKETTQRVFQQKPVIQRIQVETISQKAAAPKKIAFPEYKICDWRKSGHDLTSCVRAVIETEQPIHKDILYKRLASAFGREKVTENVKRSINSVLSLKKLKDEITIEDGFIRFKNFTNIKARSSKGEPERSIEYISKLEIADAMKKIIKNSYGLDKEAVFAETACVFGFNRMGAKIKRAMNATIDYMLNNNMIYILDGKLHIAEEV